jgi:WD40 repeat protein
MPPAEESAGIVRFSADGSRFLSCSRRGTVRVWDARTGFAVSEPFFHKAAVQDAHFNPDATQVVTASADGVVRVWDVFRSPSAPPPWLLSLADAVACQRINDSEVPETILRTSPWPLRELRDRTNPDDSGPGYQKWSHWFFLDRTSRSISPFSAVTKSSLIERLMDHNSIESLGAAVRLQPTNGLPYALFAQKLLDAASPTDTRARRQAASLIDRARRLSPDDALVQTISVNFDKSASRGHTDTK